MVLANGKTLDLSGACLVMAIVNCNKNSFYAPEKLDSKTALEKALQAEEDGADIIDFGAESTRPGAEYINAEDELAALIPAIESFRKKSTLAVSVDTRKAAVAKAALDAGADIINDISALTDDPLMLPLCAERDVPVILMHKKGIPSSMQDAPFYDDVVNEVKTFFLERTETAIKGKIGKNKIILDPGIGFGKRQEDNLALINRLAEIRLKDYPVIVGLSRKSFLGGITGRSAEERLAATIAATAAAITRGANIIRVHDVKESVDLVKTLFAITEAGI